MAESARGALEDCGLALRDVDGLSRASMTMGADGRRVAGRAPEPEAALRRRHEHRRLVVRRARDPRRRGDPRRAVRGGADPLRQHGGVERASRSAPGLGGEARDPAASFVAPYGPTTVGSYALVAQRHMHAYGTTLRAARRDRGHHAPARRAEPEREDAPADHRRRRAREPHDLEPLHLLDCCIISDGGGAVVVTSAERARDLKKRPVLLLGCGEAVCHQEIGAPDLLTIAAQQSGAQAFGMAGVTPRRRRPVHDLRLVHHHGAGDAREPGLLQAGRGRRVRAGRPHRPRRRAAGEPRRRRPLLEPPRHARHLPGDRGGASSCAASAASARSPARGSRSRTAPAARSASRTAARR